ncbi:hypothetical protein JYP51_10060 [Ponticoccus gilvus]|nr:hypothetical protein [Enemella evansiae]
MSTLELDGPDGRGGYRVALRGGETHGLIPAELVADQTGSTAQTDAEEWIAAQASEIAQALETLSRGHTPPAPFDRIQLTGAAT